MEPAEILKNAKVLGEKVERGEIKPTDLHPNCYYKGDGIFGFNAPNRLTNPQVVDAKPPKTGKTITGN